MKLRHLDSRNERRRSVSARYLEGLAGTSLVLPAVAPATEPVWHLLVIRSHRRNELRRALGEAGIEKGVHHPMAPHRQPVFADLAIAPERVPISERLQREVLSLPIGQVEFIADRVRELARAGEDSGTVPREAR